MRSPIRRGKYGNIGIVKTAALYGAQLSNATACVATKMLRREQHRWRRYASRRLAFRRAGDMVPIGHLRVPAWCAPLLYRCICSGAHSHFPGQPVFSMGICTGWQASEIYYLAPLCRLPALPPSFGIALAAPAWRAASRRCGCSRRRQRQRRLRLLSTGRVR